MSRRGRSRSAVRSPDAESPDGAPARSSTASNGPSPTSLPQWLHHSTGGRGGRDASPAPWRRLSGPSSRRTLTAVGAALLAAGAWLTALEVDGVAAPERPPLRALLVDTSAGTVALRPGWRPFVLAALAQEAQAAAAAGEELCVIGFDDRVERRFPAPASRGTGGEGPRVPSAPEALLAALAGRSGVPFELHDGPPGLGTDLAGALGAAAAALGERGRPPGRLVLLAEPSSTPEHSGAGALAAARAAVLSVALEVREVPLPPPAFGNLTLVGLGAPAEAPEGVPLALDLELAWRPAVGRAGEPTAPGPVRVVVSAVAEDTPRGAGITEHWSATCEPFGAVPMPGRDRLGRPEPGPEPTPWARSGPASLHARASLSVVVPPLPAGAHVLTVEVRPANGPDPLPHDDTRAARVEVGALVDVAVLLPGPGGGWSDQHVAAFADALARGVGRNDVPAEPEAAGPRVGLSVRTVTPPELPRALAEVDVVVTLGAPLATLPEGPLRAFVNGGGGWLHIAGHELLREEVTGVADLVALRALPPERPPRDVLFLVDGSGSMRGERWRRVLRALAEVVPEVPVQDLVALRTFAIAARRPALFSARGDLARRARELARVLRSGDAPGGETDIVAVLEGILEERRAGLGPDAVALPDGAPVPPALVLLMSDGLSSSGDGQQPALRQALLAAGVDLALVQIDHDPEGGRFLERFLLEGEEVLEGGALEGLGELLRKELHGDRVDRDVPLAPWHGGPADRSTDETAGGIAQLAQGLAAAAPPPSRAAQALRCATTTGARPVWTGLAGNPVLAIAERGGGLVSSLASAPDPEWCPELAASPARLAPLLQALGARARERRAPTLVTPDSPIPGDRRASGDVAAIGASAPFGTLALEGVPPTWPAALELAVPRPGGGEDLLRAPLERAPLPGDPGRRLVHLGPGALRTLVAHGAAAPGPDPPGSSRPNSDRSDTLRGRWPGLLAEVRARDGATLARVLLAPPSPTEGTPSERPAPPWPAVQRPATGGERGPHPWAPLLLVLGALALLPGRLPVPGGRT